MFKADLPELSDEVVSGLHKVVNGLREGVTDHDWQRDKKIAAGWSPKPHRGHTYETFRAKSVSLGASTSLCAVACVGKQESSRARLLDAAAGLFLAHENADFCIALLDGPGNKSPKHVFPEAPFVERYRAACWWGLGVLWIADEKKGSTRKSPPHTRGIRRHPFESERQPFHRWMSRAKDVLEGGKLCSMLADKTPKGGRLRSPDAEAAIRDCLAPLQGRLERKDWSFESFWRTAITDGVWTDGANRFALEVKVDEDDDAPFGQVLEDVAQYQGVLQIRVLTTTERAKRHHARKLLCGIDAAARRIKRILPIALLEYDLEQGHFLQTESP